MATLPLSPDELLTTTRAVRKRLDFDRPVPLPLIRECLEIALQAPTGGNAQDWHFVVLTEPERRKALADIYRRSFDLYRTEPGAAGNIFQDDPQRAPQQRRVMDSASYLAENMHRAPVLLVPCRAGRPAEGGPFPGLARGSSLYPAVWSYMLAARARGLGTCLTSLHLRYEREAADLLGIPYDAVTQGGLVPTAYYTGETFKPAKREPLDTVLHLEGW